MIFSTEIVESRRQKTASSWNRVLKPSDAVLLYSGDPIKKPGGLDQTYNYLPHPDFFWLSGRRRAGEVLLYSRDLGWIEFRKPISRDEKVWEGAEDETLVGKDIAALPDFLQGQKFAQICKLGHVTDAQNSGPGSGTVSGTGEFTSTLKLQLDLVRRPKDEAEIALVRSIAAMANHGYQLLESLIRPGVSERLIQIEYEAAVQKAGSQRLPYDTIVGSGTNAAILHAIPTHKIVQAGELVLIDAGADVHDYCVDVTRVFPAGDSFNQRQRAIYDLVFQAQTTAINLARPGATWRSLHEASARVIATGLKELGILRGAIDSHIESGAIAVFYPHGLGHLVGLRVRDTGCEENKNPKKHCGVLLRTDITLDENYLMTFEPGCYFIKALIMDASLRRDFKDLINWEEAEKWLDFGGVRLEDDVLIRAGGNEILTDNIAK